MLRERVAVDLLGRPYLLSLFGSFDQDIPFKHIRLHHVIDYVPEGPAVINVVTMHSMDRAVFVPVTIWQFRPD